MRTMLNMERSDLKSSAKCVPCTFWNMYASLLALLPPFSSDATNCRIWRLVMDAAASGLLAPESWGKYNEQFVSCCVMLCHVGNWDAADQASVLIRWTIQLWNTPTVASTDSLIYKKNRPTRPLWRSAGYGEWFRPTKHGAVPISAPVETFIRISPYSCIHSSSVEQDHTPEKPVTSIGCLEVASTSASSSWVYSATDILRMLQKVPSVPLSPPTPTATPTAITVRILWKTIGSRYLSANLFYAYRTNFNILIDVIWD